MSNKFHVPYSIFIALLKHHTISRVESTSPHTTSEPAIGLSFQFMLSTMTVYPGRITYPIQSTPNMCKPHATQNPNHVQRRMQIPITGPRMTTIYSRRKMSIDNPLLNLHSQNLQLACFRAAAFPISQIPLVFLSINQKKKSIANVECRYYLKRYRTLRKRYDPGA